MALPHIETRDKPLQIRFPELIREPERPVFAPGEDALLAAAADTFGWDTAFAIRLTDVNTTFAKPGVSPASWSQVNDPEYRGSGDFGPWRVALGGGGENLHMDIPITTGSMRYNGSDYSMDGAVATIEVKLQFVPQPQPGANGDVVELVVAGGSAVSVLNLTLPDPQPPTSIRFLMMGLLADWFNANLDQFTHVFCSVNLNMKADEEQFQWLKPTTVAYAYVDGPDEENAFFGVLAMTEGRSGAGLPRQLSASAIPEGARAGFLIAVYRYLEKLVMPGLPDLFDGASVDDFEIDEAAREVRNAKNVTMKEVVANGRHYHPDVAPGRFGVRVHGSELIVDMKKVHAEFSPGIDIYMDFTSYSKVVLFTKADGTHTFLFEESRPDDTTHVVEVAAWVKWTTAIAAIVVGVIAAFVGVKGDAVFKKLVYRVIAAVVLLLVAGTIGAISEILDAVATGDAEKFPGVDILLLNCTNPIKWPGASEFEVSGVGLNALLQIGGDPQFSG